MAMLAGAPPLTAPSHRGSASFPALVLALALAGLLALPAMAFATWTDPEDLSLSGHNAGNPQVAVDGSGNAVVVWSRFDGVNSRVQERVRTPQGALSATQTLSAAGQDGIKPQVAVDTGGDAVVTWERSDGTNARVQARARDAGGGLSAVQTLSDSGQHANTPQVGVDSSGNAVVVW